MLAILSGSLIIVLRHKRPSVRVPFHAPSESKFWSHPDGARQHTCLSQGVLQELLDNHGLRAACPEYDLHDVPLDKWPESGQRVWDKANVVDLLSADARACGVRVSESAVYGGARGVFAERSFEAGEHVLPFFGSIVYDDLIEAASSKDAEQQAKVYGVGRFSTSALQWGKYAVELRMSCRFWDEDGVALPRTVPAFMTREQTAMIGKRRSKRRRSKRSRSRPPPPPTPPCVRPTWIVPADCCAAGIVNDHRHVNEEGAGEVRQSDDREPNVEMVQLWDPALTSSHLTLPNAVVLVATSDIEAGSELYFDYGEEYEQFQGATEA